MEGLRQTAGGRGSGGGKGGSESREEKRSLSRLTESAAITHAVAYRKRRLKNRRWTAHARMFSCNYALQMMLWGTTSSLGHIHHCAVKCKVNYIALNVNTRMEINLRKRVTNWGYALRMHSQTKKSSYMLISHLPSLRNTQFNTLAFTPACVQRQLSCPLPAGGKHSDIELRHKSSTYSKFCSTHAPRESFFV